MEEFAMLLKRYQACIDQLHTRCIRTEQAFLDLYRRLGAIADPTPLLARIAKAPPTVSSSPAPSAESMQEVTTMTEELQSIRDQHRALLGRLEKAKRKRQEDKAEMQRLRGAFEELDGASRASIRDLMRERDKALMERDEAMTREEAAKRERDDWAQRSLNASQFVDESPFAVELALESRTNSLYANEGRDAALREQIATAKQEAGRKEVELSQMREQLARLESKAAQTEAELASEKEARQQAERLLLSTQQELRAQTLTWQEERRSILRDLELLRQVRTVTPAPPPPVVVAQIPLPAAVHKATSSRASDSLAALLRYRPARLGLIAYVAFVHLLFLLILYRDMTIKTG